MGSQLRPDLQPTREDEVIVNGQSPRHHLDVTIFKSAIVSVGRWRCPAENPYFVDSGPASDALFVFPRQSVWIEHEGRPPFVADANSVTYYNKGQCYRRRELSALGDQCDWYNVATDVLAETLSGHEPAAIDRRDEPFPFTHGPSGRDSYLRQRMVFHHVSSETNPDQLFVEETVLSVLADVTSSAYKHNLVSPKRRARKRSDREAVESAREVIARRFAENLSLTDIARVVGSSVFHLARVFKLRTGFSLHTYRNQLRLRHALDRLQYFDGDLIDIALDLGFSSHSHFTDTFRRAFDNTPSTIRHALQTRSGQDGVSARVGGTRRRT